MADAGPVLAAGPFADAVAAVVRQRYPGGTVRQTGGYVRVLVPGGLELTRAAVEAALGRSLRFADELQQVLLSFKGRLTLDDERAAWTP